MEILNQLNNENFVSKIELEKQKKIDLIFPFYYIIRNLILR